MSSKTTTTGRAFLELCRERGAVFDGVELDRVEALKRDDAAACEPATTAASDGFHGFHPLPARGRPVTNELINRLRDEPASTEPSA